MGLLNKTERIMDVVLTDKGRELLSKHNLDFTYYAFSDSLIDYSASFSASQNLSGTTVDSYVYNILTFEADGRFQSMSAVSSSMKTLDSFLYTNSSYTKTLPEFTLSEDADLTLKRHYEVVVTEEIVTKFVNSVTQEGVNLTVATSEPVVTAAKRAADYVGIQTNQQQALKLVSNSDIVGSVVSGGSTPNTSTTVSTAQNVSQETKQANSAANAR